MLCNDNESTSSSVYVGVVPQLSIDDTCTTRYAHVLYMDCGRGRYVDGESMYKGCGRDWVGMGHWSKLTKDECRCELMSMGCGNGWDVDGDLCVLCIFSSNTKACGLKHDEFCTAICDTAVFVHCFR